MKMGKTEAKHWHRCRECGALGKIDDDQLHGRTSIVCESCPAHYTVNIFAELIADPLSQELIKKAMEL